MKITQTNIGNLRGGYEAVFLAFLKIMRFSALLQAPSCSSIQTSRLAPNQAITRWLALRRQAATGFHNAGALILSQDVH